MLDVMAQMKPMEYLIILMPLLPVAALALLAGRRLANVLLKRVSFGWRPASSYLSGSHREHKPGSTTSDRRSSKSRPPRQKARRAHSRR